jgi:uncharacterized protein
VLILLPPSEGKAVPRRGRPLDLGSLSFPALDTARAEVLDALVALCTTDPTQAAAVLGLGPTQADETARNAALISAPTARADRIYTGVLYDALDLGSLDAASKRRATARLAITSGLFGLLRPTDHVPAYRLSGHVSLPGLGPVAGHWARHLAPAVEEASRDGLVVDLRSSAYAPFWRPARGEAERVVTMRVLHDVDGRRKVVSHFNKATKGRIVRDLLTDGAAPRRPGQLADLLADLGWKVETADTRVGRPTQLDVVVSAL